jgi:hypothetical protein
MVMGTRETQQSSLWVAASALPKSPGHHLAAMIAVLVMPWSLVDR